MATSAITKSHELGCKLGYYGNTAPRGCQPGPRKTRTQENLEDMKAIILFGEPKRDEQRMVGSSRGHYLARTPIPERAPDDHFLRLAVWHHPRGPQVYC